MILGGPYDTQCVHNSCETRKGWFYTYSSIVEWEPSQRMGFLPHRIYFQNALLRTYISELPLPIMIAIGIQALVGMFTFVHGFYYETLRGWSENHRHPLPMSTASLTFQTSPTFSTVSSMLRCGMLSVAVSELSLRMPHPLHGRTNVWKLLMTQAGTRRLPVLPEEGCTWRHW